MAADETSASGGDEQRNWATETKTEAETAVYEGADGDFLVETVKPLVLLRNASQYGVLSLLGGDAGDDAIQEAMASGGFNQFMEHTVVPRIVKPEGVYWTIPEGGPPAGGYDLADMGETDEQNMEDLFGIIEAMTGADQEQLAQKAEELAGNR